LINCVLCDHSLGVHIVKLFTGSTPCYVVECAKEGCHCDAGFQIVDIKLSLRPEIE
jgi:hypothetical protein